MKKLLILGAFFFVSGAAIAADCDGVPYRYTGQTCRGEGLDSNRAVCERGKRYATRCDDTSSGGFRTCEDRSVRCDDDDDRRPPRRDRDYVWFDGDWVHCSELEFRRGRPVDFCRRGYENRDCEGRCERERRRRRPGRPWWGSVNEDRNWSDGNLDFEIR